MDCNTVISSNREHMVVDFLNVQDGSFCVFGVCCLMFFLGLAF